MFFYDHHVWPRVLATLVTLCTSACFGIWYLQQILPLDLRLQGMLVPDVVLAADLVLVLVAMSVDWWMKVARVRR